MESNEYIDGLILAYMKSKGQQYSIDEISALIGLPLSITIQRFEEMLEQKCLEYVDGLLSITLKGRLSIIDTAVDYISFSNLPPVPAHVDPINAWPIDRVFIPKGFNEKVAK